MTEHATHDDDEAATLRRAEAPGALAEAVRRARAGLDLPASFQVLAAELAPRLRQYFRSHSFSFSDAEDLAQNVLSRVWKGLSALEQEERFLPWLFTIARNVRRSARARQRRERAWVADGAELAESIPDPRSEGFLQDRLEAERLQVVRAAIEQLPAQQRQCLLLRVREELSYEEISLTLRLSVHTVRNHLAAAKKNLRQRLELEPAVRR